MGLIGPNGAGKTILLEIVCGLLPADHGAVSWDGTALLPARRKRVMFYVPESVAPYPEHRAGDILRLLPGLFARSNMELTHTIGDLSLGPVLATRTGALSKGYRRRLLPALGLLAPQPLLVMDEPFARKEGAAAPRKHGRQQDLATPSASVEGNLGAGSLPQARARKTSSSPLSPTSEFLLLTVISMTKGVIAILIQRKDVAPNYRRRRSHLNRWKLGSGASADALRSNPAAI